MKATDCHDVVKTLFMYVDVGRTSDIYLFTRFTYICLCVMLPVCVCVCVSLSVYQRLCMCGGWALSPRMHICELMRTVMKSSLSCHYHYAATFIIIVNTIS